MKMSQPFTGVWLPETIALGGKVTVATGTLDARYTNHTTPDADILAIAG